MLAKRVIPTLLVRGNALVKGRQFQSWRNVGVAEQAARIHAMRGVDEMVILDIGATPEGRGPNLDLVRKLTEGNFAPIAVGGGVKTLKDVRDLLNAGADKVSICTALSAKFIGEASSRFGKQAIVAAIDVLDSEGIVEYAMEVERWGAGEILLTSIGLEGMMIGYDLELIKAVSEAVEIPVIAHGGCGTPQHAFDAIQAGASAVGIGAMFQFSDETPRSVAQYLHKNGVEVRL